MKTFKNFCQKLNMNIYFEKFQDNRIRPQIPARDIAKTVVYMLPLMLKSLLQVDQWARRPSLRNLIESRRFMVCSDSTLQRVLPNFELEPLYDTLATLYQHILSSGLGETKFPTQKKLRIAVVDGSGFGHMFASVVILAGKSAFPLDSQVFSKSGKELLYSREVLSRLTGKLGSSFCDILVGDGAYANRKDFRLCKEEYGCDLLVKSSEETLEVIQDAKGLLHSISSDIEVAKGIDTQRNVLYEARALQDFEWEKLPYSLKVCWVKEEKLKTAPGEEPVEEFYVITTRLDLTPEEMRSIAHSRWEIENNLFKKLNSLIKSKKVYTHNVSTLNTLLLLWLIGLNLLELFIHSLKKVNWQSLYGRVRITLKFILDELHIGLVELAPQGLSP